MKNRFRIFAVTIAAVAASAGIMTGCSKAGADIGRDAALEAALQDAGVSEEDATRLAVSQDNEDGRKVYEVRFDAGGKEYDYEVLASNGEILNYEINVSESYTADPGINAGTNQSTDSTAQSQDSGENNAAQADTGTQNQANQTGNANVTLTVDEAISIALERVPGATQNDVKIELDYDDGVYKYEGDIIHEQKEYEFEIDANSGTILEWSEERL